MDTIWEHINSIGSAFLDFALPVLVQSGVLIAILLLVEFLLRKKVRAVFRYWLGILVLVQLILPPLHFSRVILGYLDLGWSTESTQAIGLSQPPVAMITWQGVVFLLWLAVVILMGLLLLQRAIFARKLVRQAKEANDLMKDLLLYCCKCMGVRRKVQLKISANGTSPVVCGLLRPVILVPII